MIITHSRRLKTKVPKSILGNNNYFSVNQQHSSGIGSSYPALRDYNNGDGNGNGDDSSIQPLLRLMWIIDKREISITCTSRTTNCCKRTRICMYAWWSWSRSGSWPCSVSWSWRWGCC